MRYPTDAGLAGDGVRTLAREARQVRVMLDGQVSRVRDRSRAVGNRLRAIGRTLRRRTGDPKREVLDLTAQTGRLLTASAREARTVIDEARAAAIRLARSRKPKLRQRAERVRRTVEWLEAFVERSEKVVAQIRKRVAGEPIRDRLVSIFDPDARPIRKGKLGKQTEFGYVRQLAEVTPNTKPGARGFILPPTSKPGNPGENELLPARVTELERLDLSPREVALDGGFQTQATTQALAPLQPERTFITGRTAVGSNRTQRRLTRYRVGVEGRISHLKRERGLRRSRLKGGAGEHTWTNWALFTYNLETYDAYA